MARVRISKQASKFSTAQLPLRATSKIPPDEELNDTRKIFARILQQEGVLQISGDGDGFGASDPTLLDGLLRVLLI